MGFENRWDLNVAWPEPGPQTVYDLSHQLHTGIPHHPNHPPYSFTLTKRHGEVMYPEGVSAAAEMITTGGHVGTHMDGFAHVSRLGKIYGGHDIVQNQSYGEGVTVSSVHEMSPVLAQGHLVDVPTAMGRDLKPRGWRRRRPTRGVVRGATRAEARLGGARSAPVGTGTGTTMPHSSALRPARRESRRRAPSGLPTIRCWPPALTPSPTRNSPRRHFRCTATFSSNMECPLWRP